MKLWTWLAGRAPTHPIDDTVEPAPDAAPDWMPNPEAIPLSEQARVHHAADTLDITIVYTDSAGATTTRGLTVLSVNGRGAHTLVRGECHLRNTIRTFRADRIQMVVDRDGVIIDPQTYFRDQFGLDLLDIPPTGTIPTDPGPAGRARALRDKLRAELSILTLAGHSDGNLNDAEVDVIERFMEREADHIGVPLDIAMLDCLSGVIRRMRPTNYRLMDHVAQVNQLPAARAARFWQALEAVIMADGQFSDEEAALKAEIDEMRRFTGFT